MKGIFIFIILTALILTFQNCKPTNMQSANSSNQNAGETERNAGIGNGDGYDGKVYVEYDLQEQCGDKRSILSQFEVNDEGHFYQTIENCRPISPRLIPPKDIFVPMHNPQFPQFEGRTLVPPSMGLPPKIKKGEQLQGRLICRGEHTMPDQRHLIADVIWQRKQDGQAYMQSYIGVYNSISGDLINTVVLEEAPATHQSSVEDSLSGLDQNIFLYEQDGKMFKFRVVSDGQLVDHGSLSQGQALIPLEPGEVPLPPSEVQLLSIPNMKCERW